MNLHFALWAQQIIAHTFVKLCRPNMGSLMTAKCRKGNLNPNNLSHTRVFQQTQPHFKVGGSPAPCPTFFLLRSQIFHHERCGCSFLAPNTSQVFGCRDPTPLPPCCSHLARSARGGSRTLSRSASAWRGFYASKTSEKSTQRFPSNHSFLILYVGCLLDYLLYIHCLFHKG